MIRTVTRADSEIIADIYNFYVANTVVTFEEDLVSSAEMLGRIVSALEENLPWLVAEEEGKVIGYAYVSKWKGRCAYRYSVESTVYLDHKVTSKGWGSKLYTELLKSLKDKGFHVVMGGISLPNANSVSLHEKFGFEKVAHFKEVGHKFGAWVDVGYWQVTLSD